MSESLLEIIWYSPYHDEIFVTYASERMIPHVNEEDETVLLEVSIVTFQKREKT